MDLLTLKLNASAYSYTEVNVIGNLSHDSAYHTHEICCTFQWVQSEGGAGTWEGRAPGGGDGWGGRGGGGLAGHASRERAVCLLLTRPNAN